MLLTNSWKEAYLGVELHVHDGTAVEVDQLSQTG